MACGQPDSTITRLTPDIAVAPNTFDFGDVVQAFSVEKNIQVVNAGRAPLEISDIYLQDDDAGFTLDGADAVELKPDDAMTVTLGFTPNTLGDYETVLVIESNDEEAPVMELSVNGSGVIGPQPDIELTLTQIDFGDGTEGVTSAPQYLILRNVGDGPLIVNDTVQSGSGAFEVTAAPGDGEEISSGSESVLAVTYTPDAFLSGHLGTITFFSNDPDEPEVSVVLKGGDGTPYDYPVAVIQGDTSVRPPADLSLDGTASTDPMDTADEYDLTYSWTILDKPDDSNARFDDATDANPDLIIDIAGTFTVQLIVTDWQGVPSAPAFHTVDSEPVEDLYIALSWDKNLSDVDLHVIPSGVNWFGSQDASFCNYSPDWGEDGHASHSGDISTGLGPESVEIGELSETEYFMGVHYFEDNGGSVVTATITIYVEGEEHEVISKMLAHNDFWEVGYMHVQNGVAGFVESEFPVSSSEYRECAE